MANRQKFANIDGATNPPQQPEGSEGPEGNGDEGAAGDNGEGSEGPEGNGEGKPGDKGGKPKPNGNTYTDADVDEIVKKRLSRERSQIEKQIREQIKREADDQRSEAEKLANMNDLQRAQYALDKANKEKAELERRINLSEQMGIARAELKSAGIDLGDELLSMFVTEKADDTNAAISKIKELFPKAVDAAVQEALKRKPPTTGSEGKPKSFGASFAAAYSNRMNGGKKDGAQ